MHRYLTLRRSKLNPRKSGILCSFTHFPGCFFYMTSFRLVEFDECLPIYIHHKAETKCYLNLNENNQSANSAECCSRSQERSQTVPVRSHRHSVFIPRSFPYLFPFLPLLFILTLTYYQQCGVSPWRIRRYLWCSFLSPCIVFIKVDPGVLSISGFQSIKM